MITYFHQVQYAVSYGSLVGGLVKAFVFGILVAGIGCLRGLQTDTGATAVGESTTSAVVSGIILIAITDGIFSVVYYYLGVWMASGSEAGGDHPSGELQGRLRRSGRARPLNFEVYAGEVFAILGGSGSGKSTLLKHMIGLYKPAAGRILIDGEDIAAAYRRGEAQACCRNSASCIRAARLFGSMTLLENIALPLEEFTDLPPEAIRLIATMKLATSRLERLWPTACRRS